MNALSKLFRSFCVAAFLIVPANCFGVLVVQGFKPAKHDRFANVAGPPGFLAPGRDLSGVGRAQGGGWATLLNNPNGGAPTHFVSARHAQPQGQITFFPGNDPSATPITCSTNGGTALGDTDIWIGFLDVSQASCNTGLVTGYDVALDIPTHYAEVGTVDGIGAIMLQAGVSEITYDTAHSFLTTNMRFGRNEASFLVTDTLIGRTGDWMIYEDDSLLGDLIAPFSATPDDLNPDETLFQGGDSGGPSFLDDGPGTLQLIGIHSFVGEITTNDLNGDGIPDVDTNGMPIITPIQRASGDAYLPTSRSAILAEITAVPEPSSWAYLGLITIAAYAGRLISRHNHGSP